MTEKDLTLLDTLNKIPLDVYNEINILSGASDIFIEEVAKLESMTDLAVRGGEALEFLTLNRGLLSVDYKALGKALANPDSVSLKVWRNLYLLERSIPPRNANWSWVDRLKMFYNTYLEEHQLVNTFYKGHKLLFITGHNKEIDHENLVAGPGHFGSDFYYFDDSLPGGTVDKMVKVEMKYAYGNLDAEVAKYNPNNNNHTYNAKHVVLYKEGSGYYMVDYTEEQPKVEKLNVPEPTGLFKITL